MSKTVGYPSITHCDGLIVGLIVANLWEMSRGHRSKWLNPWVVVTSGALALTALHAIQKEVFDFTGLALFFGALVWFGVRRGASLFDSRLFYWGSRLSFGMYLNNEYLAPWVVDRVLPHTGLLRSHLLANLAALVIVVIVSAAFALVTFCLVEHPFLQLRKALMNRSASINLVEPPALVPVSQEVASSALN